MGSDGYSALLTQNRYRGKLNLHDACDPAGAVLAKVRMLASMVKKSQHVVVHTGAGLSTAAGIADFRGPRGVWTLEKSPSPFTGSCEFDARSGGSRDLTKKSGSLEAGMRTAGGIVEESVNFENAAPTLSHMAIVAMYKAGYVKYVISQNVDGLHLRSGLPRSALSELHGNLFMETCVSCNREYFCEFEVKSVGFKQTGRKCSACGGDLTDKALDWDDALPEPDYERAIWHSKVSDLAVVIGSSCQMNPARNLPFRSKTKSRAVLVNLSKTDKDSQFTVRIGAPSDLVFAILAEALEIDVPQYERTMELRLHAIVKDKLESTAVGDKSENGRPCRVVNCWLESTSNCDSFDRIPLIDKVEFDLLCDATRRTTKRAKRTQPDNHQSTVYRAPYRVYFENFDSFVNEDDFEAECTGLTCRAKVQFRSMTGGRCATLVSGPAGDSPVLQRITAVSKSYDEYGKSLLEWVIRDAMQETYQPCDADAWFCRGANKRSHAVCVVCGAEVHVGKKSLHARKCMETVISTAVPVKLENDNGCNSY